MRQPKLSNDSALSVDDKSSSTAFANIWLNGEQRPSRPEYLPRLFGLACSSAMS